MPTNAAAPTCPASCPRTSTHGPTPASSWRVSNTVTPAAASRSRIRRATSQVKACSGYPASVSVPVVLQGLVPPAPSGTGAFTTSGCAALPPLWPGSSTTTGAGGVGAGVVVGVVVVTGAVVTGAVVTGAVVEGGAVVEACDADDGAAALEEEQPARTTRSARTPGLSHRTGPA